MKYLLQQISVVLALLLLLTACGKTDDPPAVEQIQPEETQEQEELFDLSVFDGIYRANVPVEGDEGYVQITALGECILLEHFLCMEGSVYSFWAEEFWTDEDGAAEGEWTSVSGMSQTFSVMTETALYDTMPKNRVISLTDAGVVLQYDDSDAEYYVRELSFAYHTAPEELRQRLGDSTVKEDKALFGTWSVRNGREALCVTFNGDGDVRLVRKAVGEPIQVFTGGYIFVNDGVEILAEKVGDGQYPYFMGWQYQCDRDGMLWLTFDDGEQFVLLPTGSMPRSIARQEALAYIGISYHFTGQYTDQYDTTYDYRYRLPRFYGDDEATAAVNAQISERFGSVIEEELEAMEAGEFISFQEVDFESNIWEDVLYLHVYARTWDWEEHGAYYYDIKTGTFLSAEEVLDRLLIDQDYFLEAVREEAQTLFEETFAELPEEDREEYGYYEMLEWTGSDEAVNLQLPIFVDRFVGISVYAKIGSMAGSGIIWNVLRPFDGAVG